MTEFYENLSKKFQIWLKYSKKIGHFVSLLNAQYFRTQFTGSIILLTTPVKMKQTERSETSARDIQTLWNHPKEGIQHPEQGKSLKPRILKLIYG